MRPSTSTTSRNEEMIRAAMLARFIVSRAEPGEFGDPRSESVVAPQLARVPVTRKILRWLVVTVAVVAFVLLPMLMAFGGETERVRVAAAKTRLAMATQAELPLTLPREELPKKPTGPRDGSRSAEPHELGPPTPPSRGLRLEIDGSAVSSQQSYAVTVYTAAWCGPCHSMQSKVGNGDDSVSVTWVASAPPRGIPEIYPTCCWHDASGTLRYSPGVKTLEQIRGLIERNNPPMSAGDAVGASGVAGTIQGREVIRSVLDRWKSHIGSGAVTFSWSRNGSQALPLLRLKEWSAKAIYGTSGSFNLNVTGATEALPVTQGVIDYRIDSLGKLRLRGETEVDASILGITHGKTQAVGSAQPVGFSPMLILSGLSIILQLMNPQMDVILPGEISATATLVNDTLTITFKDAPSVKVVMWFSFNLRVESVAISEAKVVAKFSGSRWITQKVFEVK